MQWQWPSKPISYRKFVTYTIDIYPHWLVIAFPVKSGQGSLWIIPWYTNFQGEKPIKGDQLVFATTPGGCTAKWFLFLQLMWHWCRAWFFCTNTTQLQSIWSPEISLHVLMGRMDWRTVCMRTLFNEDVVPLQMSIHFIVGWRRRTFFGNSKHQSNIVVQYPSQVAFQKCLVSELLAWQSCGTNSTGKICIGHRSSLPSIEFLSCKNQYPKAVPPFIIKRPCFAKVVLALLPGSESSQQQPCFWGTKRAKKAGMAAVPPLWICHDLLSFWCTYVTILLNTYSAPTPAAHENHETKPRRQCQIALFKCVTLEFWGVALPSSSCADFLTKRVSSRANPPGLSSCCHLQIGRNRLGAVVFELSNN